MNVGRNAVTPVSSNAPGDAIARRIRIEEVDPGEAVHLQVDEPGEAMPLPLADGSDARDPAATISTSPE